MKLLGAVIGSLAMLASTAFGAEYQLKLAHEVALESTQHAAATRLAELVRERTNGAIEITVYPNSTLGTGPVALNLVRGGTIDIVQSGSTTFNSVLGETAVLELPYLFRSPEHAYSVLDGEIGQDLLDKLGGLGMQGLAFLENGWRSLTNNRRPVETPEEVKGLKIRTTPNPYHILAFQLLGANPVPMAYSELFTALETGAVDAQEHPLPILWAAKFYEVQKYLSVTRHAYSPLILVMNKAKYDGLKPDYQKALLQSARDAATYQRELNAKQEAEIIEGVRNAGLEVIEQVDAEPFRKIVEEPLRKAVAEKYGLDLLNAIVAQR